MTLKQLKETVLDYLVLLEPRILNFDKYDEVVNAVKALPDHVIVGVEILGGEVSDVAANVPIDIMIKDYDTETTNRWIALTPMSTEQIKTVFSPEDGWDAIDWNEEETHAE